MSQKIIMADVTDISYYKTCTIYTTKTGEKHTVVNKKYQEKDNINITDTLVANSSKSRPNLLVDTK